MARMIRTALPEEVWDALAVLATRDGKAIGPYVKHLLIQHVEASHPRKSIDEPLDDAEMGELRAWSAAAREAYPIKGTKTMQEWRLAWIEAILKANPQSKRALIPTPDPKDPRTILIWSIWFHNTTKTWSRDINVLPPRHPDRWGPEVKTEDADCAETEDCAGGEHGYDCPLEDED